MSFSRRRTGGRAAAQLFQQQVRYSAGKYAGAVNAYNGSLAGGDGKIAAATDKAVTEVQAAFGAGRG